MTMAAVLNDPATCDRDRRQTIQNGSAMWQLKNPPLFDHGRHQKLDVGG